MQRTLITGFFLLVTVFSGLQVVLAQETGGFPQPTGGSSVNTQGGGGSVNTQGGGGSSVGTQGGQQGANKLPSVATDLMNPLGNTTIQQFFLNIIKVLLVFAVPIIVFFIIYAGFQYVTARGNTEKISKATSALTWALVGGVIILGAELILQVIQGTVNQITGGQTLR